jgi:hypothetical protein
LARDPEARVPFPVLSEKKVVGLERGPLSLVSTTEELLDRKMNLLGDNIGTIKKNTESLIDASNEVGLEIK